MAQETKEPAMTPWFELPFYRGLTEKALVLGVPKSVIAVNMLVAVLFILDFHFFYIIPLNILIHFGAIYVCKGDAQFFECLKYYISKKNYYTT